MKLFLILSLVMAGCVTTSAEVRSRATLVQVSKLEPAGKCQFISAIRGTNLALLTSPKYDVALEDFRIQAAQKNANYAVIDGVETIGSDRLNVNGRAFHCAEVGATPATSCLPICSPGFTCSEGKCISACNPACQQSERCGDDRLCHKTN